MTNKFFGRWSRLKSGEAVEPGPKLDSKLEGVANPQAHQISKSEEDLYQPQLPTLEDAQRMDHLATDFSMFMKPGVDPAVQELALKKMFADPRFNVICPMDEYVLDASMFTPMPESMLKRLAQSRSLNLFAKEDRSSELEHRDNHQAQLDDAIMPIAMSEAQHVSPDDQEVVEFQKDINLSLNKRDG